MEEKKQDEKIESVLAEAEEAESNVENARALEEEMPETAAEAEAVLDAADEEKPLDKNIKLMSPTRMVLRRFFRSKLSVAGLVMLIVLFAFCWLGPAFYRTWDEDDYDRTGKIEYSAPYECEVDGVKITQIVITDNGINKLAPPSASHPLGTDEKGMDILARLMKGGRRSLTISFLAVFMISAIGIILGGIAGYYGGIVDSIIMRLCDILMCLPTLPLMLIIGTVLDANNVPSQYYIYLLMTILAFFSWTGMARLVRGQILFLREQEYMVAAEAMGFSTGRKIFKHLIPNVLPQILVTMTLSLGSMILYESTLSYLNLGVRVPLSSWGTMVQIISTEAGASILKNNFNVWGPPGICIIIAVLGFNFIGDGLRDALDPKQRR